MVPNIIAKIPIFSENLNLDKNSCSTEINYWLKEKRTKNSSKAKKTSKAKKSSKAKKFGKDEKSYITNVEIWNLKFKIWKLKVEIWRFHISDVYKQNVLTVLLQLPRSPSKDEKSRKVKMSSKAKKSSNVKKYSRSEHHALGAGLTSWRAWGSWKWDLCCHAGSSCPEHLGCYLSKCQTVNEK